MLFWLLESFSSLCASLGNTYSFFISRFKHPQSPFILGFLSPKHFISFSHLSA